MVCLIMPSELPIISDWDDGTKVAIFFTLDASRLLFNSLGTGLVVASVTQSLCRGPGPKHTKSREVSYQKNDMHSDWSANENYIYLLEFRLRYVYNNLE